MNDFNSPNISEEDIKFQKRKKRLGYLIVLLAVIAVLNIFAYKRYKRIIEESKKNAMELVSGGQNKEGGSETDSWMNIFGIYGYRVRLPNSWSMKPPYFSYTEIEYYNEEKNWLNSAPMHVYDYVYSDDPRLEKNIASVKLYDEFVSELEKAERKNPDAVINVGGVEFTKYDLVNFKENEGKDYGNVVVVMGPEINLRDARKVRFAIEWYENPAGKEDILNSKDKFLKIISTLEKAR